MADSIFGAVPITDCIASHLSKHGMSAGDGSAMSLLAQSWTYAEEGLRALAQITSAGDVDNAGTKLADSIFLDPRGFHLGTDPASTKLLILERIAADRKELDTEKYAEAGDTLDQVMNDLQDDLKDRGWEGREGTRSMISNILRGLSIEAHLASLDYAFDLSSTKWNQAILVFEACGKAFARVSDEVKGSTLDYTVARAMKMRLLSTFVQALSLPHMELTRQLSLAVSSLAEDILKECKTMTPPSSNLHLSLPFQIMPISLSRRSLAHLLIAEADPLKAKSKALRLQNQGRKIGQSFFFDKLSARKIVTLLKQATDELPTDDPDRVELKYLTTQWLFRMGGMRAEDILHQIEVADLVRKECETSFGPFSVSPTILYCHEQAEALDKWLISHNSHKDAILKPVPRVVVRSLEDWKGELNAEEYKEFRGEVCLVEIVQSIASGDWGCAVS